MLRTFFASTLLALPLYANATPAITKVSISGDYVEVWGTGFGTKTNVKPLAWLDHEAENDPSLYRTDIKTLKLNGTIVPDISKPGNMILKYDLKDHVSGGPEKFLFNSDHLYVSVRRFYNFDITKPELLVSSGGGGLNLKPFRLWTEWSSQVKAHSMLFGYQGKEGAESGRITPELTEEFSQWTGSTVKFKPFVWFTQEYLYKSSELNVRNGLLQIYTDGKKGASKLMTTISTNYPDKYKFLYFDQVSNYNLSFPLEVYYDDIYIDDTHTRIVLNNAPTPADGSRSYPLIPVEWSDTYVKAKLTKTAKEHTGFCLFVYDASNIPNPEGFCPLRPKAPLPL